MSGSIGHLEDCVDKISIRADHVQMGTSTYSAHNLQDRLIDFFFVAPHEYIHFYAASLLGVPVIIHKELVEIARWHPLSKVFLITIAPIIFSMILIAFALLLFWLSDRGFTAALALIIQLVLGSIHLLFCERDAVQACLILIGKGRETLVVSRPTV